MRFPRMALLGTGSLLTWAAACSSNVTETAGATTTGSGGAGSAGSVTVSATASSSATSASVGSSSSGTGGKGGDNGTPSNVYPAPHADPPQVVTFNGPVLASPKIVPVFFADYDATLAGQVTDLDAKVGATQYWAANVTEYGVGAAVSAMPVKLTEMAPASIDDAAIQTWLAAKLNGNDPAWPAPDANTVYSLHYPVSSMITSGGALSCQDFGGYHANITLDAMHGSMDVAYAVIPSCPNFGAMSLLDATTTTETHELIEAATDPYPMTNPAYITVDSKHAYWSRVLGGGETGDLCAQFGSSFTTFAELPYLVQRSWSNKAALAGHDPCVPSLPGEVYFNTAPVLNDTITAMMFGQSVLLKGVKIPVGQSKTVELDLFSDAATTGPWTVSVKDVSSALMGGPSLLDFSLDKDTGVNGEKLHLTITSKAAGKHGTAAFIIDSLLGAQKTLWIGIVGAK